MIPRWFLTTLVFALPILAVTFGVVLGASALTSTLGDAAGAYGLFWCAMAALIGLDLAEAKSIATEASSAGVCAAANDNGGGQVVLSGAKAAVERAVDIAKARGVKRAMMLPVSAPFHCLLMQPAADVMAEALTRVSVKAPLVPVVANVPARPVKDPAAVVRNLVEQITATVRWRESVLFMAQSGVSSFFEIGAGKVLTGLIKRIAEAASAAAIGSPEDIARFKASRG